MGARRIQGVGGGLVRGTARPMGRRFGRGAAVSKEFRRNLRTQGWMGLEKKFVDYTVTNTAFTNAWAERNPAQDSLCGIAQGDGESNRDGRVAYISSIHIRGWISLTTAEGAGAPQGDGVARLAVVWDTQTNEAEVVGTNVFDAGASNDHLSHRNLNYTQRFRVLMDKSYIIRPETVQNAANDFSTGQVIRAFSFNHKFKTPVKVVHDDINAAIADITDNSFHLVGIGNTELAYEYEVRTRFYG